MKKIIKAAMILVLACFIAFPAVISSSADKAEAADDSNLGNDYKIAYQFYTQDGSWSEWVKDNQDAKTDGKDIGAIKIKLNPELVNQGKNVSYRVYIEDYGWQNWVSNGEETGEYDKYRVEAIQVKIVDKDGNYDREYSVCYDSAVNYDPSSSDIKWAGKTRYDGESSGTTDKCVGLRAFKVKVTNNTIYPTVKCWTQKTQGCNESADGTFNVKEASDPITSISLTLPKQYEEQGYRIIYRVFQNNHDEWSDWVQDGQVAGEVLGDRWSVGDWIKAIQVKVVDKSGNTANTCNVRYLSQIGDKGVETLMKHDGKTSGNIDEDHRIEAIKIDCKLW